MKRRMSDWLRGPWDFLMRLCVQLARWLGALLALVIGVGLFWKLPEWYVAARQHGLSPRDLIELENQTRATWAQVLGGAAGLVLIYLTWRRIAAIERAVEISEEGHITERFTRAIEQLGSGKREVRVGGIYALERIARDSEKDHWTTMEVLTAFVRERAPWSLNKSASEKAGRPRLYADIQAVLTVIGRRKRTYNNGEDLALDLFGTDLRKADLRRAHLEKANFNGACLVDANLLDAHLEGADFWEAHLQMANLCEAHMEEAVLTGAHLEGADMSGAVGLTREQIDQAITDAKTKLPDHLAPDEPSASTRG
jgi:hypothetical protein